MPQNLAELRQMLSRVTPWVGVAVILAVVLLGYFLVQGWRYWQASSITTTDCQIWYLILRIRPRASHRGTLLAVRFKPKLVAKITLSDKPSL